jgi:hypothetical protein
MRPVPPQHIIASPDLEEAMNTVSDETRGPLAAAHDEFGPVDLVVIGFPPGANSQSNAGTLLIDLVDSGIIRVLDVMFVTKEQDGTFSGFEATGLDQDSVGSFAVLEGASSGLLGSEDVATAAGAIEPGTSALLLLYENRWAAPFAAALRHAGGEVLDNQRIPHQAVIDALDAIDAAS